MKIALLSDLHIFSTSEKKVVEALTKAAAEKPDVMVIAGDHSGSWWGYKGSRAVFRIARSVYDGPIVACLGNHDYWYRGVVKKLGGRNEWGRQTFNHPNLSTWLVSLETIHKAADEYNIHLFETKGIFRHPTMYGFTIIGHGLWYAKPPYLLSKDADFMPIGIEGDTHRYMYKRTRDELLDQLNQVNDEDIYRVFVSHFPVVELKEHDLAWAGDPGLGDMLRDQYKVTTFLNGHTHDDRNGPVRWECGSDNYNPKYKIITI